MHPMEFCVKHLEIAGEWRPPVTEYRANKGVTSRSDAIKASITAYLRENGECEARTIAAGIGKGAKLAKAYLCEMGAAKQVYIQKFTGSKPALYRIGEHDEND